MQHIWERFHVIPCLGVSFAEAAHVFCTMQLRSHLADLSRRVHANMSERGIQNGGSWAHFGEPFQHLELRGTNIVRFSRNLQLLTPWDHANQPEDVRLPPCFTIFCPWLVLGVMWSSSWVTAKLQESCLYRICADYLYRLFMFIHCLFVSLEWINSYMFIYGSTFF